MRLPMKTALVAVSSVLLPAMAFAQYTRTDLVTNTGAAGTVQDAHLVNAWGLVSTTTSPFWISDNATGLSTLYSISNSSGITATSAVFIGNLIFFFVLHVNAVCAEISI